MVKKIKTQEEKLSNVVKDIESKEEYVKQVHFEMQQIDGINDRIKAELGTFIRNLQIVKIIIKFTQNAFAIMETKHFS